jgi:glycosyltransferase involved in cell wall biosynthesis
MAEAMALGVPVVAANWSANVEFMKSENSYLVPYHLIPVREPKGSYRDYKSAVWAEPDTDAAAVALRKLCEEWRMRHQSENAI